MRTTDFRRPRTPVSPCTKRGYCVKRGRIEDTFTGGPRRVTDRHISEGKENVKNKRILTGITLTIAAALAFAGLAPLPAQQGKGASGPLITVLNPAIERKMVDRIPLSPRLDTLDGKTLYLVNTGFVGTERLMEVMTEWFAANHPRTTIVNKRNPSMDVPDKALWAEIQEKADAVIIGLGH